MVRGREGTQIQVAGLQSCHATGLAGDDARPVHQPSLMPSFGLPTALRGRQGSLA